MLKLIGRGALACAVVCAAAGGAMAQTNSQKMAGGTWACTALASDMNVVSKQSYTSDGKSSVTVMVFGESSGVPVKIAAVGEGTWTIVGDQLDETLSYMTATFAEIDGEQNIEAAQNMLDESMVNVLLTNFVAFKGATLRMEDADGVVTDCVR